MRFNILALCAAIVLGFCALPGSASAATTGWVKTPAGSDTQDIIRNPAENLYMDITSADTGRLPVVRFLVPGFICFESDIASETEETGIASVYGMCVSPPTGVAADDNVCKEIGTLQSGTVSAADLTGAAISSGKQQRCIWNIPSNQEVYVIMDGGLTTTGRFRAGGH